MFLATYYDAEVGDMDSVQVADSFDEAVADVLRTIGQSPRFVVEATNKNGELNLTVSKGDIVLATVSEADVRRGACNFPVIDACHALKAGEGATLLAKLFTAA